MTAYDDGRVSVHLGDCLDVLRSLPDASVDAVVTDPPYGLEFMGKEWDAPWKHGFSATGYTDGGTRPPRPNYGSTRNPMCRTCRQHQRGSKRCVCLTPDFDERPADSNRAFQEWCEAWARECLRVLKPGGHMLAFGGTRTWHRLACAVEDAGFEVRDSIAWLYGSGFPKSLDVSKAIDKAAGAERTEVVGTTGQRRDLTRNGRTGDEAIRPVYAANVHLDITAPATPDAEQWQGWGTALKPAFEPVVVARKPLQGTVAANVLQHGTGALNVDACRVEGVVPVTKQGGGGSYARATQAQHGYRPEGAMYRGEAARAAQGGVMSMPHAAGRWPTNVVLDESQAAALDEQSGERTSGLFKPEHADNGKDAGTYGAMGGRERTTATYGDTGGASRFFPTFRYEAKAPATERPRVDGTAHPTVKPLDLMRWLVRLVTPPGGTVLEPFAGSGTTVEACIVEGFRCIAIEREADYLPLILQRIHRRRDPVAAIRQSGDDLGLFELDGEPA